MAEDSTVDQNSINKKSLSSSNKIILAICCAIILMVAVLFALDYFKSPLIRKNLPKDYILNSVKTSTVLEEKAKNAGYSIIWQGDKNDPVGRTILASENRLVNGKPDKLGWTSEVLYDGRQEVTLSLGVFSKWMPIPGTNDYYAEIFNPKANDAFLVRILINNSVLGSKSKSSTLLYVDDLNNGPRNSSKISLSKIGNISDLNKKTREEIIKKGDVVYMRVVVLSAEEAFKPQNLGKNLAILDEKKMPIASLIAVRRFGGKEVIDKEIQR